MAVELSAPAREQTRARYPDESGYVERDGVRLHWEVYGSGEPTVLLLPTWSIIHSRHWKMQIPYLARHCRVLTFDGRGNGRSDRPQDPEAYNKHVWLRDYRGCLEFFFSRMFNEPHSTKPIEDCVGWGLETDGETLVTAQYGAKLGVDEAGEIAARIRCPVLVIHGSE